MVNEFSQETLKNKRFEKAVEVSAQLFLKNGIEAMVKQHLPEIKSVEDVVLGF